MKKPVGLLLFFSIIAFLCLLGVKTYQKNKEKKQAEITTQQIPDFKFLSLSGKEFTLKDLSKREKILFVFFNPSCEYCQMEAKEFAKNYGKLRNIQILFVSGEPINELKKFSETYQLSKKTNIIFLYDDKESFYHIFNVIGIPYMVLYDASGNKINTYKGGVNLEKVFKDAQ